MNGEDGSAVRLVPRDGRPGRVVIELPMDLEVCSRIMLALSEEGFEFEHLVNLEDADA